MTNIARRVLLTMLLVLPTGPTLAIDYFPTENGAYLNYYDGGVTISSRGNSVYHEYSTLGYHCVWHYVIDANGDVLRANGTEKGSPDWTEIVVTYSPPVVYLDLPLEAGKTWSTTTLVEDSFGESYVMVLEGYVGRPMVVAVPAGSFEVFEVNLWTYCPEAPWHNRSEPLWLHRQLGQVMNLVYWSGIVGTTGTTWGQLKALFR